MKKKKRMLGEKDLNRYEGLPFLITVFSIKNNIAL